MAGFILGIVSSLAATVLTVTAGWFGSSRMRHWLVAVLSRLTGLGIQRSYRQQKLANLDLGPDLAVARWVKVLAGRGNELTRDSFRAVWEEADSRLESVHILLPDPGLGPGSFVANREAEILRQDTGYSPGLLAGQISSNIEYVSTIAAKRSHVSLRLYDLPNIYRIILTDRVAYFTTYAASGHGRNAPCVVFSNPGTMYDFALRTFSIWWDHAHPPSADRTELNR
jgi:hypothetical protein